MGSLSDRLSRPKLPLPLLQRHLQQPFFYFFARGSSNSLRKLSQRIELTQISNHIACLQRHQTTAMAATSQPSYSPLEERPLKNTICLFDVDGTLTPARLVRQPKLRPAIPDYSFSFQLANCQLPIVSQARAHLMNHHQLPTCRICLLTLDYRTPPPKSWPPSPPSARNAPSASSAAPTSKSSKSKSANPPVYPSPPCSTSASPRMA